MSYWLDYSAAKLPGATIKAAGYTGVIRYIDAPNLLSTKHTDLNEYRSHIAAGLTVRLVHQGTTTDADSGFQGGVNRATRARAGAEYLGYTGVIYFTNDRTTLPNPGVWQAYLDGAASVLGKARVGAYGFNNALNAAVGHASAFWQAGRRSDLVPHANFWQDNNTQVKVGGITCDRNLVLSDYSPTNTPGPTNSGGSTIGAELMERITVTPPNAGANAIRVLLSGTDSAAVVVRPRIDGKGVSKPMWVGDIFAWGNDHQGVGQNPTQVAGYNNRLESHRRYSLKGAVWADLNYSASEPFEIDCF